MPDFDSTAMYAPTVAGEPDWQRDEDALFDASLAAVARFQKDQPSIAVSAFGFDSEPCYGYALICFETPANALTVAMDREERGVKDRYEYFATDSSWKIAKDHLRRECIEHSDSTGYFAFSQFAHVTFEGWESFAAAENYPKADNQSDLDYLEGHACLIFWRVIERLVDAGAFNRLNLWSPFRIGFNFHGERFLVVRMLNRRTPNGG